MRGLWIVFVLIACSDTRPPKTQDPVAPSGSGSAVIGKPFEPSCSSKHAPQPDRDPSPMCLVPANEFMMGTPVDSRTAIDGPARKVRISRSFFLDQLEVTNSQFVAFLRTGNAPCKRAYDCFGSDQIDDIDLRDVSYPIRAGRENHPVNVTVHGAEAYCGWVGKRLPTEAEWELAARHDPASGEDRTYPWGNEYTPGVANIFGVIEPRRGRNAPVGTFAGDRSPVGVLDMGGNATEWVADCFSLDFWCTDSCVDPKHTTRCEQVCTEGSYVTCDPGRVQRGGDSATDPEYLASKRRQGVQPDTRGGIRCASLQR